MKINEDREIQRDWQENGRYSVSRGRCATLISILPSPVIIGSSPPRDKTNFAGPRNHVAFKTVAARRLTTKHDLRLLHHVRSRDRGQIACFSELSRDRRKLYFGTQYGTTPPFLVFLDVECRRQRTDSIAMLLDSI